jgi:mRNA interferase MazF
MMCGNMPKVGDVVIANIQFADATGIKTRPGVVLFQELGNIVVAGVTSNPKMKGIPLYRSEGAIKDSVIKLNYIFTITEDLIYKVSFRLSPEKKRIVFDELTKKLEGLKA